MKSETVKPIPPRMDRPMSRLRFMPTGAAQIPIRMATQVKSVMPIALPGKSPRKIASGTPSSPSEVIPPKVIPALTKAKRGRIT